MEKAVAENLAEEGLGHRDLFESADRRIGREFEPLGHAVAFQNGRIDSGLRMKGSAAVVSGDVPVTARVSSSTSN